MQGDVPLDIHVRDDPEVWCSWYSTEPGVSHFFNKVKSYPDPPPPLKYDPGLIWYKPAAACQPTDPEPWYNKGSPATPIVLIDGPPEEDDPMPNIPKQLHNAIYKNCARCGKEDIYPPSCKDKNVYCTGCCWEGTKGEAFDKDLVELQRSKKASVKQL